MAVSVSASSRARLKVGTTTLTVGTPETRMRLRAHACGAGCQRATTAPAAVSRAVGQTRRGFNPWAGAEGRDPPAGRSHEAMVSDMSAGNHNRRQTWRDRQGPNTPAHRA